jgi:hypothetical protein
MLSVSEASSHQHACQRSFAALRMTRVNLLTLNPFPKKNEKSLPDDKAYPYHREETQKNAFYFVKVKFFGQFCERKVYELKSFTLIELL